MTMPQVTEGHRKLALLVGDGEGREHMQVRLTWDMTDPERMVSSMEMSQDGKDWKQLFDAVYTRRA